MLAFMDEEFRPDPRREARPNLGATVSSSAELNNGNARASHTPDEGHERRQGPLDADIASICVEVLELIGLPAASLSVGGNVLALNHLFNALIPSLILVRNGRLSLRDRSTDALLRQLTEGPPAPQERSISSIPLAGSADRVGHIIHLVPACLHPLGLQARIGWICLAEPIVPKTVPEPVLLQELFHLTTAEARVAHAIARGQTVNQLADKLGLSRETIRAQLKTVFIKTGVRRQADLIALLSSGIWNRSAR